MFMCILFLNTIKVNAVSSCPTELRQELAQISSHIKVNYEIQDKSETKEIDVNGSKKAYKVPKYAFAISIYNLTADFYAEIEIESSASEKKSLTVYFDDTVEGNYSFYDYNIGDIYNYRITIHSTNDECSGRTFRTFRVTKPRYNAYSEYTYCQNSTNFYCQRFVASDLKINSTSEFLSKIKVNNEKNNPNKGYIDIKKELADTFKANWPLYIAIFIGVALIITGIIIYFKKRNKKTGWKI